MATITFRDERRALPRLLLRRLTEQLGASALFGLLAIGVFVSAADLMGNLSGELRDGIPFTVVLRLQILKAPGFLVQGAWAAMLASMLLVLGQMARRREYVAMLASGVSIFQISIPVLGVACVVSLLVFGIQEGIVPSARDAMAALRGAHDRDTTADLRGIITDVSYRAPGQRFYVLKELDVAEGAAQGVVMDRIINNRIVEKLEASAGFWDKHNGRWIWLNAVVRAFDADQRVTAHLFFRRRASELHASPKMLRIEKRLALDRYDLAYLSIAQLRERIATMPAASGAPVRLAVVYHAKWSEPFTILVVALLAIPGALSIERRGPVRGVVLCVAACAAFFAMRQVGLALGRGGALPPALAAWGAHLIAAGVGVIWLRRAPT